eukprot:COSAG01_NODE_39351_length_477_cov_2.140212_1_plen_80_part_10
MCWGVWWHREGPCRLLIIIIAACACGRTLRHPRRAWFCVAGGAGTLANGVTNFLYLLQILLSVYLLLDRRRPSASRCSSL